MTPVWLGLGWPIRRVAGNQTYGRGARNRTSAPCFRRTETTTIRLPDETKRDYALWGCPDPPPVASCALPLIVSCAGKLTAKNSCVPSSRTRHPRSSVRPAARQRQRTVLTYRQPDSFCRGAVGESSENAHTPPTYLFPPLSVLSVRSSWESDPGPLFGRFYKRIRDWLIGRRRPGCSGPEQGPPVENSYCKTLQRVKIPRGDLTALIGRLAVHPNPSKQFNFLADLQLQILQRILDADLLHWSPFPC